MVTVGALTVSTTRHRSGRTLVEHCDFVTDLGHDARQTYGFLGDGGRSGWSASSACSTSPTAGCACARPTPT